MTMKNFTLFCKTIFASKAKKEPSTVPILGTIFWQFLSLQYIYVSAT